VRRWGDVTEAEVHETKEQQALGIEMPADNVQKKRKDHESGLGSANIKKQTREGKGTERIASGKWNTFLSIQIITAQFEKEHAVNIRLLLKESN